MTWDTKLKDGYGSSDFLKISPEGAAHVVLHTHPPLVEHITTKPFRSYFTLNNDGSTSDMRVNGSVTPQTFKIVANKDTDTYVKSISVVISDVNATLSSFGSIGVLTNGVEFHWMTADLGLVVINEGLKSNFDFVRLSGGQPSGVNGPLNNVISNAEGFIPFLDLAYIFGMPYGVRLRKGTLDELCFKVNDNLSTGLDAFNIIAYGIQL